VQLSAKHRAFIALGILAGIVAACVGAYVHYRRAVLTSATAGPAPLDIFTQPEPTPATSEILSELPTDAPALGYLDAVALRRFQGSRLAALLGLVNSGPQEDRDYQQFVRATGFDYSRDLERVAIAFWPAAMGEASPNIGGADRALAIVDGRFDQQKIEAYALKSGRLIPRAKQFLYQVPGNPSVALEFLSPTRIALASGKNPVNLLTASRTGIQDPVFQARINRVAGAPLFAVVRTDRLPDNFYAKLKNSAQIEHLARSVRGLALAAKPGGDILRVALEGETTSATNAVEIATLLDISRMGFSMALSDPKTRAEMTKQQDAFLNALIRQLKITHQDRWVRLRLDITPEMLEDSSQQR
jgi:hypothetical protein